MTEQKRFEGKKEKKLLIFHMVARQFSKRKMILEAANPTLLFHMITFLSLQRKLKSHSAQLAISIYLPTEWKIWLLILQVLNLCGLGTISESVIIPNTYLKPISANFDVCGKTNPVIQHLDFEQSGPFFPNFPNWGLFMGRTSLILIVVMPIKHLPSIHKSVLVKNLLLKF